MNPVEPRAPEVPWFVAKKVAEHQPEYLTLPALVDTRPLALDSPGRGAVVSVWEPTDYEMLLLARAVHEFQTVQGHPRPKFTLTLWTFGKPVQPIHLVVGERSEAWMVREGEPQSLGG